MEGLEGRTEQADQHLVAVRRGLPEARPGACIPRAVVPTVTLSGEGLRRAPGAGAGAGHRWHSRGGLCVGAGARGWWGSVAGSRSGPVQSEDSGRTSA